ncbi:MAG TPA: dihydrofolate reductase family protein [Vicinamibacterales bacterium]
MRKVIYGGACSLDGFFTDRNGSVDWLIHGKAVQEIMRKSWATVDTILFGRKTWEWASSQPGPADDAAFAGIKSYVFSRTLTSIPDRKAELVTSDAGAFVKQLKSEPGRDIIVMSGGDFAASLLKAGVVDEVGLNIHPVLLGGGAPAFLDAGGRISLELTETRQLDGGCVYVNYRVTQ